jgi:hypothetical protein
VLRGRSSRRAARRSTPRINSSSAAHQRLPVQMVASGHGVLLSLQRIRSNPQRAME